MKPSNEMKDLLWFLVSNDKNLMVMMWCGDVVMHGYGFYDYKLYDISLPNYK